MHVSGPTLGLRLLTDEDVPALFALGQDPEVVRWFSWGPYRSPDEPRAYIAAQEGRRERGEQLDLLVVSHADGPIGVIGLSEYVRRDRRAIVGTWLGRHWWGTGANAEAKRLLFALAFGPMALERIGAYCDPANARSVAALQRLGFEREGLLRGFHRHGTIQKDVLLFGLSRERWAEGEKVEVTICGELPSAFVPA